MANKLRGISKGAILRTAVLVLALVNTSLQLAGYDVLPFAEADVEMAVTVILNAGAALAAWWKNQAFTQEAKKADAHMRNMKERKKTGVKSDK